MATATHPKRPASGARWSARVTANSHAMDLEPGVFAGDDPARIAASVLHSAQASKSLKASPYRSALSMITFYCNRAGSNLSPKKKDVLRRAKQELKHLAGRRDA